MPRVASRRIESIRRVRLGLAMRGLVGTGRFYYNKELFKIYKFDEAAGQAQPP